MTKAHRKSVRERAHAREEVDTLLERASHRLKQAASAKTCTLRTELAVVALESAAGAGIGASHTAGSTARLRRALDMQAAARKLILSCAARRRV